MTIYPGDIRGTGGGGGGRVAAYETKLGYQPFVNRAIRRNRNLRALGFAGEIRRRRRGRFVKLGLEGHKTDLVRIGHVDKTWDVNEALAVFILALVYSISLPTRLRRNAEKRGKNSPRCRLGHP